MNSSIIKIAFFIAFALATVTANASEQTLDVYLAYTLKDKPAMRQIKDALDNKKLRVKRSPLDFLALADYSAKQKKLAKFNSARVVVIITSKDPSDFIDVKRLDNVIITNHFDPDVVKQIEQHLANNN